LKRRIVKSGTPFLVFLPHGVGDKKGASAMLTPFTPLSLLFDFVELLDTFFKTSASPQGHRRLVLISASTNFH
jgi:hypothetical protein